jgi:transposase
MSSARRARRAFTGEKIVGILKEHLIHHIPIAEVCKKYDIQPTQYYRWQQQWFAEGAKVFDQVGKSVKADRLHQDQIAKFEEKLRRKNDVLGELMEEYIRLKKELGEH